MQTIHARAKPVRAESPTTIITTDSDSRVVAFPVVSTTQTISVSNSLVATLGFEVTHLSAVDALDSRDWKRISKGSLRWNEETITVARLRALLGEMTVLVAVSALDIGRIARLSAFAG
jgi:hypothetical protein